MDGRPPPSRQVWRPQSARNGRNSDVSIDDRMSDTSDGSRRSRSPHVRSGVGSNWRSGYSRSHPSWSGLPDLRDHLNESRSRNVNPLPTSRPEEDWQSQGRRRGRGRGQGSPGSSNEPNWRGREGQSSSGSNVLNWRGSQGSFGPNVPTRRTSQDRADGPSGFKGEFENFSQLNHDRSQNRRGGRNYGKKWNNRSSVITKLETKDDWINLSNLDNTLRIVTKLQEFEPAWVKSFHTTADFDVLNSAFDVFSSIDLKYRYAKLALMKSLFTNQFIERLVQIVENFKTTWFQAGKEKVLSFVEKLRTNIEFVLSNDAAFHDSTSSKEAIGLLIAGCVGTLELINTKLMDLQGSADGSIEKEIAMIQGLSEVKFTEMQILEESIYPDDFKDRYEVMANIIHGAYQSDDHYIQTHFSLLKEDFQSVLREGVEQYLIDPKKKNFNIWAYENVVVKRFHLAPNGRKNNNSKLFFKVTFPDCHYFSKIQWNYVKRFMFGSLVVLTADKFSSYYFAMIEERSFEDAANISIVICFVHSPPNGVEDLKFLLVEPKVFFEPYLNSMKVLKCMARIGLPMKKYIVKCDTAQAAPAYLSPESSYKIGSYNVKVNEILSWPKAEDLGLNRTQKEAFINALTSEMALIQGPPGTGKTFLAFKIIETLLKNVKNSYVDGPIMIVCYKNHSLDQILEGLLNKGKSVVRIGSQSKIKALKYDCNVTRLPEPPTISSLTSERNDLRNKLDTCLAKIKETVSLIFLIKARIGILSLDFLKQFQIIPEDIDWSADIWLLELLEEAPQLNPETIKFRVGYMMASPDISALLQEYSLSEIFDSNLFSIGKELIRLQALMSNLEKRDESYESLRAYEPTFWEANSRYWSAYDRYIYLNEGLNFTVDPSDCPDNTTPGFDYFELALEERWALYRKWESDLVKQLEARIVHLENQVPEIEENLLEYEEMVMSQKLKYERPQVIGVTTSGATKHYSALADVGAKIVLVEEAAEVLESHVIASLSTKCQHLILIGDHQQLKPNTASFDIGTRYRMNVSLFERMIKNDIKLSCLTTQHRMRPEIAALVSPAIYKNLENHPSVEAYPNVIGTKKNVYFLNHDHQEQVGYDSDSKFNPGEGDMLIAIAHYLIRQGYKSDQITILSTYLEQDRYLKKTITKYYNNTLLKEVFCTVVDNYQGEENTIILLSLVRSNPNGDVGFLSTKNRVCVALSRAKHGLFIFGNMECLSKKEPTIWSEINEVLIGQEAISSRFPLKCVRHLNITEVASREEVEALKHAGCLNLCDAPLPCGHTCKIMCHGEDQEHNGVFKCREQCMKRCNDGHTCQAPCRDPCPPCPFMMPKLLVCGHSRQLECHKSNLQTYCTETVEIKLEKCGHNQLVLCKLTEQSERHRIVCKSDCKQEFRCGHVCKRTCHVSIDPDHKTKFVCGEPCDLINKSCPRKHRCRKKCREPCGDCLEKVEKTLPCDHKAETLCYMEVDRIICHKDCERTLPCGHNCKNKCNAPCGPCKIKVEKVIEECGHSFSFSCSDTPTRSHCQKRCQTVKSCGHPCTGMCKEICEELHCTSQVIVTLPCEHEAFATCGDVKSNRYAFTTECEAPCEAKLPCGHRCQGTCGSCLVGRVHIACNETCNKPLLCKHNCPIRCSSSLHSCFHFKCFNTCWQKELKNRPRGPRKQRGKKLNEFDPKKRMAFEIRNELKNENDKMGKVARGYNGNKAVLQCLKKIQMFVNKSRTMTNEDKELPTLKTCLFKVEFISVFFVIMMRLEMMKLPSAKNLELESFLEKLAGRSASNNLMGIYEMTQLQEQLLWVSLVLDVHKAEASLGPKNDSVTTDGIFDTLNEVKTSFGPKQRLRVRKMLKDYFEKMDIDLPLTPVDMEDLFPSTDKYCKLICHHRVDKAMESAAQNDGQECAEPFNDGKNRADNVNESLLGGTRSLVSEDYNDGCDVSEEVKSPKKRAKLAAIDVDDIMHVEEVSPAPKSTNAIASGISSSQTIVKSAEYGKWGPILQKELNCLADVDANQTVEHEIAKEQMQPAAVAVEKDPDGDTSLLSQMSIEADQSDIDSHGSELKTVQTGDSCANRDADGTSSVSNVQPGQVQAQQTIPNAETSWSLIELVDSSHHSSNKQLEGNQGSGKLINESSSAGTIADASCVNADPTPSSSSQSQPTAQTNRISPRPIGFEWLSSAGPAANRLDAEPWRNLVEPDAHATVYLDEID